MKKLLLLAALAASSMAVSAQDDVVNMVVNGNFEAPGYEQAVPGEYTWSPVDTWEALSVLPGWTLSTGGVWNGVISLITGEDNAGDGDLRPEEDTNTLLFRGYVNNGWTDITASQIVKNLVPGRKYTLDFLLAESQGQAEKWTPEPNYGYKVSEVDGDKAGKEIVAKTFTEQNVDLELYSDEFIAPADGQVYLTFYLANKYYDDEGRGNYKTDLWMELDLVRIYSEEGDEEAPDSAVAGIINDAAPVELYNLQGVRVNKADAKGIYILKQGNKSTKVIL
ncbi:MAG: hypothetical protein K2H60_12020 [Muribaculaceae bacterium]|nr:hypothetical protein [Muribaculaceae bacterium]